MQDKQWHSGGEEGQRSREVGGGSCESWFKGFLTKQKEVASAHSDTPLDWHEYYFLQRTITGLLLGLCLMIFFFFSKVYVSRLGWSWVDGRWPHFGGKETSRQCSDELYHCLFTTVYRIFPHWLLWIYVACRACIVNHLFFFLYHQSVGITVTAVTPLALLVSC